MYMLKSKWKRMRWPERIAFLLGMPCAAVIILLAALHLLKIKTTSLTLYMPLVVVLMLSQCVLNWRKNKKAALISLGTAAFVCLAYVLVYVI